MKTTDLRRAGSRFHTKTSWLDSWHSFSFGNHRDPKNQRHGLLLVNNDDIVDPGSGFGWHPHRDMEIVTWVLDGELEHGDSTGNRGIIYPGLVQRMTAGRGIFHTEMNPSSTDPVHFLQMWVLPDEVGLEPSYEQLDVNASLDGGGLVPVAAGGDREGALRIHQRNATLWIARLNPEEKVDLPPAAAGHLFLAKGAFLLDGETRLDSGDALRLIESDLLPGSAGPEGAEILYWQMSEED